MVTVLDKPNFPPYVCVMCGAGNGRAWYADLGIPLDNYFNPVNNGAVYICNECWDGMALEVAKQSQVLVLGHQPWEGRVEPTYDDDEELETLTIKEGNDRSDVPDSSTAGDDPVDAGANQAPESDDDDSEPDDSDPESESVREFRGFFAGGTT
jgi:hypothetical protein